MITKFGSSLNGIKIGFQYEGFEFSKDRKYARLRKPRVVIFRDSNIVNHKNLLSVSGTVILRQHGHTVNLYPNINCSGKGRKIIQRLTGEWILLDQTKEIRKQFRIILEGVDLAGNQLVVGGLITYPKISTI